MKLPGLFKSSPDERQLLVIDYSSTESRLAYFHDDDGELIFGAASRGPDIATAYQSLAIKPAQFTDCVLGVPYLSLTDNSTVVRYRRPKPQDKITEDEVTGAFAQAAAGNEEDPFFEDLFSAKVGYQTLSAGGANRFEQVETVTNVPGFLENPPAT